ncbi:hypothetical protein H0G86_013330 [Trichoderma simmonsii]|uniref:Uncharacterized protein n=1 Tax=Trichoderma simmonsii TaxID=1491479 RepID=A0A8G0L9Q1_9HYPO|nr:hypothetical protein H0G86_013330 [Trichoderma simmonsii]
MDLFSSLHCLLGSCRDQQLGFEDSRTHVVFVSMQSNIPYPVKLVYEFTEYPGPYDTSRRQNWNYDNRAKQGGSRECRAPFATIFFLPEKYYQLPSYGNAACTSTRLPAVKRLSLASQA